LLVIILVGPVWPYGPHGPVGGCTFAGACWGVAGLLIGPAVPWGDGAGGHY
jgi:hypothetical protein